MKQRGYFGIGIYDPKTKENIGTLWRSAYQLGASFIFTIGSRYAVQASDTCKTYKKVPMFHYRDVEDFLEHRPRECPIIPIEFVDDNDRKLEELDHPEQAIYLLGAEDTGIPVKLISKFDYKPVRIPCVRYESFNVAVAGSIVMYDRLAKLLLEEVEK